MESMELKKLFRKFSEIKGFDGWMIGKLVFYQQEKSSEMVSRVKKRKEKAAVLEAVGGGLCMEMYLLKPEKVQEKVQAGEQKERLFGSREVQMSEKVISRVFSEKEILAFAEDVEDENPIHRTQKPVVPGLLMAEWLWMEGKVSLEGKKMTFHAPAYAKEEVTVYLEKKTQVYFGMSDGRLLWKVSGCGRGGRK